MKSWLKIISKKEILSWAFYDFANSAYALIVVSFVFPIFYREVIAGAKLGDFYWGLITSVSILIGALIAPIIGAMADEDGRKKIKFTIFSSLSMGGTALLFFTGSGTLLWASLLFIAANIFFEISQTIYDSFLGHISTRETVGKISGFAWGLGYVGGVAALLLFQPLFGQGYEDNLFLYKLTFPLTALFFLLFSIPAFLFLKDENILHRTRHPLPQLTRKAFQRVWHTVKHFREYRNIAWFLFGLYLFNDALVTMFTFMPLFARTTLQMSIKEIAFLLLLVQLLAFPFTAFFGWLSDKKGSKPILLFAVAGWAILTFVIYLAETKEIFYLAVLIGSMVMGSSQATARSWLSKMVPPEKRSEFFGFNGFASKIAATTGPIVFGALSSFTGNQRNGVLAMIPFFILAFFIFARIKEER
ncbi:MAG: MFS transporter [bacterium]|nr:MFS transporter [bacterium]